MPKTKQQKAKDRERRVAKKKLAERKAARQQADAAKDRDAERAGSAMTSGIQKAKQDAKASETKTVLKAR